MEDDEQVSERLPQPPPEGWECEVVEDGDGLAVAMGDEMYASVEILAAAAEQTVEEFLNAAIDRALTTPEKEADNVDPIQ